MYANLGALRRFDLPLYVALPWKESPQHEEVLAIVVGQGLEYGRSHRPWEVREVEAELAADVSRASPRASERPVQSSNGPRG